MMIRFLMFKFQTGELEVDKLPYISMNIERASLAAIFNPFGEGSGLYRVKDETDYKLSGLKKNRPLIRGAVSTDDEGNLHVLSIPQLLQDESQVEYSVVLMQNGQIYLATKDSKKTGELEVLLLEPTDSSYSAESPTEFDWFVLTDDRKDYLFVSWAFGEKKFVSVYHLDKTAAQFRVLRQATIAKGFYSMQELKRRVQDPWKNIEL